MSANVAIQVHNLTKSYRLYNSSLDRLKESLHPLRHKYHREFKALNGVSFEIMKGETVGIVGKNGSGKSTLLKVLTGVTTPTNGMVTVNGKIAALLELSAGFNPMLTGIENVYFNGALMGYSRAEMDSKLDNILAFADIGKFVYQPVKTYSSGMFVRLAFSIAINVEPDVLIVDEALAVGDELFQRKCYSKIRSFAESGATILFVSHSPQLIAQMCNRAILLDNGVVIKVDSPNEVITLYHKMVYGSVDSDELGAVDINKKLFASGTRSEESFEQIGNFDKYLPGYTSQNAFGFRSYGVELDNIKITNSSHELVNVLTTNCWYTISYRVFFAQALDNAYFGMCLKTATGIAIGWFVPPYEEYIRNITEEDEYIVEWRFKCTLLTGAYSANVSVYGYKDDGFFFYNRITDALAFKVETDTKCGFKGIVNFEQRPKISKI